MAGPLQHEGEARRGIATVQALRALACLMVVAYHATDAWGARQHPGLTADQVWANGAAGVDLFFVISGFVMAVSSARLVGWRGAARFVSRRLRRVVPLYWVMTCLKLALLAALPVGAAGAAGGAWHVLASLLFIPSRDPAGVVRPVLGVGWTLQFEMLFYALFALALLARGWRPGSRAGWLLWPPLLGLAVAGFFRRPDWPAPAFLANGLVLEFCFGLAVAHGAGRLSRLGPRRGTCLALAGLALLLALPQPGPWRGLVWGAPAAMVLSGAVSLEPALGRRLPAWLLAAGEASYATYLLHPFLVPVLALGAARALPSGLVLPAAMLGSLGASLLGGLALHRWVDRRLQAALARSGPGRGGARQADVLAHLVQT